MTLQAIAKTLASILLATSLSGTIAAATPRDPAQNEFHFVVLGDSQFHDPATYNRMIDDIRHLSPAFVIQVGDMIEGYQNDPADIRDEWQRFGRQIAPLAPISFLPVPGNHDLYNASRRSDQRLEAVYKEVWGEPYYSFDYLNSQFIVLNSDAPGEEGRIGPTQWNWLAKTLKDSNAQHIFVFMHRPAFRLKNADKLHDLLRGHPVRYVFYGHHHHYHFSDRDGIGYVMTNAAADGGTPLDQAGNFDHLLQVSVRDDQARYAVIRADGIEAPDYVHPDDNYDLYELTRNFAPKEVQLTGNDNRWTMTIPVSNPTNRELTVYTECGSDDERWLHEPTQLEPVELSAKQQLRIEVSWSQSVARESESIPYCDLRVPYQTVQGEWFEHRVRVLGQTTDK
jgi:hypothetical protein